MKYSAHMLHITECIAVVAGVKEHLQNHAYGKAMRMAVFLPGRGQGMPANRVQARRQETKGHNGARLLSVKMRLPSGLPVRAMPV